MDFALRPAKPADAHAVESCVHKAFGHYVERIGMQPGPMRMDYEKEIREHQVYIVDDEGQVIGVLVLCATDEGFLLDVIAVDPRWRGNGIGKLMLEFAEIEAKRQGYDSIYLFTHEKMTENQALYKRIGYVEYDRRHEMGLARVYMRKLLK
jgi:GNAT superfamily N-acetyltransferase